MSNLLSTSVRLLKRNSPTILTCIGAVGVVATTVMAVKATPKALAAVAAKKEEKGEDLTRFETIVTVAPSYAPSIVTGAATIACIFGANVLNKRSQASLISAYALLDKSYKDHKHKVKELFGDEGVFQVNEAIAKDKYKETDIQVSDDKELFYDLFSGRYFESTIEEVMRAEYNLNRKITIHSEAYLNDFYLELGLEPIESGWEYGWESGLCHTHYWQPWVDFNHEEITIDDNLEQYDDVDEYVGLKCTLISMKQEPIYGFADF